MSRVDYRYTLRRGGWDEPDLFDHVYVNGCLCWVMLNPSTADDNEDDPTIRRCIRFTKDNGYSSMVVVNVFAARATKPTELIDMAGAGVDPRGYGNGPIVGACIESSDAVIFAWGATIPRCIQPLADDTIGFATAAAGLVGGPLCLGTTKDGSPRHPLYVAADQPIVAWACNRDSRAA